LPVHSVFGRVFVSFVPLLLLSCAGQAPPAGGPVDTEPPVIISVYPAPNTTMFNERRIAFEFDKYVDHRSFEQSVFVSPVIEDMEFDWSGREVEMSFQGSLKEHATYVVTVGTDVVDLHNKNRMAQAFTLAFSTGEQIDRGAISGRVFPVKPSDSPSGIMIFAYNLEGIDPDTLNPAKQKPYYVTQSGEDGSFLLNHLALRPYRIFAVRDDYKNLLYDPEVDEFGVPSRQPTLSAKDTIQIDFRMRLAKEDTTAPRLVKVTPVNTQLLIAEFSEPIDTATVTPSFFVVTDTLGTNVVQTISTATLLPKATEVLVGTDVQKKASEYLFTVSGVRDLVGHRVSPLANVLHFTSSDSTDMAPPNIGAVSPVDSARNISVEVAPIVFFVEPVQRTDSASVVELLDSTNATVACARQWLNDAAIQVRPLHLLKGNMWYHVAITMNGLRDDAGNVAKDTIIIRHFLTQDPDQLSSIEGSVTDGNEADTLGSIIIRARNVASQAEGIAVHVSGPGPFQLNRLPEGKYTLDAFRDRNENGRFDPGSVFPYQRSERFAVYQDTLKLRARWPLEGVKLHLQ
jgi:Bacterial Ig-like domain